MKVSNVSRFLYTFLFLLGSGAGLLAQSPAADAVLARLSESFADISTVQSDFVEKKTLSMLDNTITITGSVAIEQPDRLAWRVNSPLAYTLIVSGRRVRQWDEDSGVVQTFSASGNPIISMVIQQMQEWFSGNFAAIQEGYDVHVRREHPVVMQCVPHEGSANAKVIESITVSIREDGRYVESIRIQDVSGDVTHIAFQNTVLNEPVPKEAWSIHRDGH